MTDSAARLLLPHRPWLRRGLLLAAAVLLAILALYPQRYRAVVTLTPSDPSSIGLAGTLGQLGAQTSVFGQQAATEVSLTVARSTNVRHEVIESTKLIGRLGLANEVEAQRWLEKQVQVRVLRGGLMEFSVALTDPALAKALIVAYTNAVRDRLAILSRQQTASKRKVLEELVGDAATRLARAQAAYDQFRLRTRYSAPNNALEAIGSRVPLLEEAIRSRETRLAALRQFATEDNLSVKQIVAEIDVLRKQLAQAKSLNTGSNDSVARVVNQTTQVEKLQHELAIAHSLNDAYVRFLEGTSVEDLASALNVRILEPPHIDPDRQYNLLPALMAFLVICVLFALEFYHLRPPAGVNRRVSDDV